MTILSAFSSFVLTISKLLMLFCSDNLNILDGILPDKIEKLVDVWYILSVTYFEFTNLL